MVLIYIGDLFNMVKIVKTKVKFFCPITIYDTEIINDISRPDSSYWDYEKGDICVAGFLMGNEIIQVIHEHNGDLEEFKKQLWEILKDKKDLYSFNFRFEHEITKGLLGKSIFISEIKSFKGKNFGKERFFIELVKDKKVKKKEIPKDPFNGNGGLCMEKWKEGKIDEILEHNRSCLIEEYFLFINKQYLYDKFKNNIKDGWFQENDKKM